MNLHSTAVIHPKAELGEDVIIGPYCVIGEHVKIGAQTELVAHVHVEGHTKSGDGVEFFLLAPSEPPPNICNTKMSRLRSLSETTIFFGKMSPSTGPRSLEAESPVLDTIIFLWPIPMWRMIVIYAVISSWQTPPIWLDISRLEIMP